MGPGRGRRCGGVGGEARAWAHRREGPGREARGDWPSSAAGGGHSSWVWGLRRARGHADGERVYGPLPSPPPSQGDDSTAARVTAAFVPSACPFRRPSPSRRRAPAGLPALGPRTPIRLVLRGCGWGTWVWALSGRRRSGGAWAACNGELLLDAVLRAPPQGSRAAAACRRRRRVSPLGEGPGARWLLLFNLCRGTPFTPPLA